MTSLRQIQTRIEFLEKQLGSLENYLPETYQFLMAELDSQYRELMAHRIQQFYQEQQHEQ